MHPLNPSIPGLSRGCRAAPSVEPVAVAVLGCGFVADFYMATLAHHPGLRVVGAYDRDPERLEAFCRHHAVHPYPALPALLADGRVEMVLNLTNPRSHFALTRACLEAGKHVYSEKPLAMNAADATTLAVLARCRNLQVSVAPCSVLGETAQTMWKALAEGMVGRVRLVYANFEDGMVHRADRSRWRSASGAPWPAQDEFEVGSTLEHAGYVLSWLAAFFGPAHQVQAYSRCLIPDKGAADRAVAPDFSVGCIEYGDGLVARVTCGLVAPVDKSLVIVGDDGILATGQVRNDAAPVVLRRMPANRVAAGLRHRWTLLWERLEAGFHLPVSIGGLTWQRRLPFALPPRFRRSSPGKPVDFLRGPAELAEAVRQGRECRLSAELGVHLTELSEALQHPERYPDRRIRSRFAPIAPLPWRS